MGDLVVLRDALVSTKDNLVELVGQLRKVMIYLDLFRGKINVGDYRGVLEFIGVVFETDEGVDWDDNRLTEAYNAILAIARSLDDNDNTVDVFPLFGAIQFLESFGGTILHLVNGPNPENLNAAATTTPAERGIVIYFYTQVGSSTNHIHTRDNIIHEFGHVVELLTNNSMYNEWEQIRIQFSREGQTVDQGFTLDEGWGTDFEYRQNRIPLTTTNPETGEVTYNFQDCTDVNSLCQEYEIERIADMFLFWVIAEHEFDTQNTRIDIQERALAMENFTRGIGWTRQNGTVLSSRGFRYWAEQIANSRGR
jgi:hypothetical protein